TAVPGLAAKDIIDIQITVADLADARIAAALSGACYTARPDIGRDHRPPGARLCLEQLRVIEIVPYRPEWAAEFAAIAADARRALGPAALRIDHIGSTAVPDLAAKDIIDVQITVADLADGQIVAALSATGFTARPDIGRDHRPPGATGPDADWIKRYFREPPGRRPIHIHVRAAGRPNQRYPLLVRDYLRAHPAAAAAYAEGKRRLSEIVGGDSGLYADTKDPISDLIALAAEAWAASAGWEPGPSDA
ncbi:MAG TPA: GrpB family protein, partial [Thermomicrobiales bacterium]|nr:GrpB family protein [Thermomicrobiales bacterium]